MHLKTFFVWIFTFSYFVVHFLLLKQEFLCAIDVTSAGTPNEKLQWAFRMYDVDGNGSIDLQVTIMRTSPGAGPVQHFMAPPSRCRSPLPFLFYLPSRFVVSFTFKTI